MFNNLWNWCLKDIFHVLKHMNDSDKNAYIKMKSILRRAYELL